MVNKDMGIFPNDDDLIKIRNDMLRFAQLQLKDTTLAEDAVQEAFAAAFSNADQYAGRASVRTWVFTILKNKIVDQIRRQSRMVNISSMSSDSDDFDEQFEKLFNENGYWLPEARPRGWESPEDSLQQSQFWIIFEACLSHLPEKTARIFMMREFLELHILEICSELGITASNCSVTLHRARLGLRGCLDRRWFNKKEGIC